MIKYINDLELKYETDIGAHLRDYNRKHSPQKPAKEKYFYVLDNEKLIGALYCSVSWNWVGLRKIFYDNVEVLELLLAKVCKFYKNTVTGIKAHSSDRDRIDDFISIGFVMSGVIPGTPMGGDYFYADNTSLDIVSNSSYKMVSSNMAIQEYQKGFDDKIKIYNFNNIEKPYENISFVALDNSEFVGGVLGELTDDSMYIDLLVVREEYRGRQIATKLMKLIEEEAVRRNVVCLNLATTEFQAKGFYSSLGFEVIIARENNPVGFKCFTMIKWLND